MSHLLVVAYHYVLADQAGYFSGLKGVTEREFATQIGLLADRYSFMAAEELSSRPWRDGIPRCLITFDDGTKDQLTTAAPILGARGIRAVYFVTTGVVAGEHVIAAHLLHQLLRVSPPEEIAAGVNAAAVDGGIDAEVDLTVRQSYYQYDDAVTGSLKYQLNHILEPLTAAALLRQVFENTIGPVEQFRRSFYLDVEDLRSLESAGHAVSAHSHSHINLAAASPGQMRADVERAAAVVTGLGFSRGRPHFAVPFGGPGTYTEEVRATLRANGFGHMHVNSPALNVTADGIVRRYGTKQLPPFVDAWPGAGVGDGSRAVSA